MLIKTFSIFFGTLFCQAQIPNSNLEISHKYCTELSFVTEIPEWITYELHPTLNKLPNPFRDAQKEPKEFFIQTYRGIPVADSMISIDGPRITLNVVPKNVLGQIEPITKEEIDESERAAFLIGEECFGRKGKFNIKLVIMPWCRPQIVWRISGNGGLGVTEVITMSCSNHEILEKIRSSYSRWLR